MANFIHRDFPDYKYFSRFLKISFFAYGAIWIFFAITFRVGDVLSGVQKSQLGTTMLSPQFFDYQIGNRSEETALNAFYPNLQPALDVMNANPDNLILRVGTSFSYFITNNTNRIFIDNQLGMFDQIHKQYKGKRKIMADVLAASNFKYIIIDLNTPFIDQTPEQSLKKKYNALMSFVMNNTNLKLLATNRIYTERSPSTGKYVRIYKMFPNPNIKSQISFGGSYAIYEIL